MRLSEMLDPLGNFKEKATIKQVELCSMTCGSNDSIVNLPLPHLNL